MGDVKVKRHTFMMGLSADDAEHWPVSMPTYGEEDDHTGSSTHRARGLDDPYHLSGLTCGVPVRMLVFNKYIMIAGRTHDVRVQSDHVCQPGKTVQSN